MNAEIVAIGTELLLGQNLDTNSSWLAQQLALLGVDVYGFQQVGDNERRMEAAIKGACERSQVVITTGGLGPTVDDLTRKVVSRMGQRTLVYYENIAKAMEAKFFRQGKSFPQSNLSQAFIPQGATMIPNPIGTAPGFILKINKSHVVCLPGVPSEMKAMFDQTVRIFLKGLEPVSSIIKSRVYRTTGMSESRLNEKILDIFENSKNPTIGVLANAKGVDIRLTAKAASGEEADQLIDALGKTLTTRLPSNIYGLESDELETIVGQMLRTRQMSLAIAESCTGGLISHRITKVPGSSIYFLRGYIVYSNEAKSEMLKVDPNLIKRKGAVSEEVAEALAVNARVHSGASIAISTTGIAGPAGGSEGKPVGLIYIGLSDDQTTHVMKFQFTGDREVVQLKASQAALEILRRHCLGLSLND